MKRAITLLALIMTFLVSVVSSQSSRPLAPEGTEGETYFAPFPANINLDGEFGDWDNVPLVIMGQGVGRPAMSFAAAADGENLYFYAEIVDSNIISGTHGTDYWNEDSLEIYLNASGDLTRRSYTEGVVQITIPALNAGLPPEEAILAGVNGADAEARIHAVLTENGWVVEVAVPLETAVWSIVPQQDAEIGFQIHLNAASEANRDSKLIWSVLDTSDSSYQNPSVFGRLIFHEVSATPIATGEYTFISSLSDNGLVDDFENGIWLGQSNDTLIGLAAVDSALSIRQVLAASDMAFPAQEALADNVLAIQGTGFVHQFTDSYDPVTQDWSAYNALGLWLYGANTAGTITLDIVQGDTQASAEIADDFAGWQHIIVPFAFFQSETALDFSQVAGYGVRASGQSYLDDVQLFNVENTSEIIIGMSIPEARLIIDESINWDSREWELLWSDEFDAEANTAIDSTSWTCETGGHGWGNNELEYYTNSLENVSHDGNGNLVITAIQGQPESGETCWYGQCAYTSARCITRDKVEFTYGRVEARLQIPRGTGVWPAFWMLGANFDAVGWPNSGEIDIMENIGSITNTVYGTVHGPGYSGASGLGNAYPQDFDFSDDFHVYAIDWDENIIRWYVDGNLFGTISVNDTRNREWVFNHDFFLLMNVAVGGAWPGFPNEDTVFPQQMLVDYIRVYQLASE